MLILPIWFSVITYDPISICCWSSFGVWGGDFSVQSIVKPLEETVPEVHVADRVDVFEVNTSWKLTVWVCPFMFNAFHMPLVYNYHNSFTFTFINLFEKVLISLINENALEFWEENICILDKPINLVWIQTLLRKLRWLRIMHSTSNLPSFKIPKLVSCIWESFPKVLWKVHSGFME